MYEKRALVGGRIRDIMVGDERIELGAAIVHSSNTYMVNFTEVLGLSRIDEDGA